jgi:hypothetical protein
MENCMKFNRMHHINDFYTQDTICNSSFSVTIYMAFRRVLGP